MAKFNTPIPKELSHLKLDDRGYPIPFFAAIRDGKPDFRLLDVKKQRECIDKKLCAVCGLKLHKDYSYIITGPIGLTNRVSTDPPMHRVCAEFSIQACPHLLYKNATRRETGVDRNVLQQQLMELEKPSSIFLVRIRSNFNEIKEQGQSLIKYVPVASNEWIYIDGILQEKIN